MRAVILAETPPGDVFTAGTCAVVADELSLRGAEVQYLHASRLDLAPCVGCFDCWTRTPGICRFRDEGEDLVRAAVNSEVLVLLGPITFGGHAPMVKRAMERLLPMLSPFMARQGGEVYRLPRYKRLPAIVGIGTQPDPDAEAAKLYRMIVERNALHLHAPAFGVGVLESSMPTTEVRLAVQGAIAAVDRDGTTPRPRPSGPVLGVRP